MNLPKFHAITFISDVMEAVLDLRSFGSVLSHSDLISVRGCHPPIYCCTICGIFNLKIQQIVLSYIQPHSADILHQSVLTARPNIEECDLDT